MQDPLNSELRLQDHSEIKQSVYSVDNINIEFSKEKKADLLEDADNVQGQLCSHNFKFPLFEVDVESLVDPGGTYMMDELMSFECIVKQQVAQPDEVINNNRELLGSNESDLIKYLLHDSVATHCLEDTEFSSELCIISIIELSHREGYSTLSAGVPVGHSIWSMEPIMFDEVLFFDLDPYYFLEVFSDSAKEIDAETCESMFGEVMNFKNFSQLIVCHALTLMDDSFKSLPVPIFSDHENISSSHKLLEELLAQLDWQSSSASDGLYLDWHYLEGDHCESAKYSSCWKMLCGIETYKIDAAMNSTDNEKMIFNFILSEGHPDKQNADNYKEHLNLSCDVPTNHSSGKADLSNLNNQGDGKRISEGISLKTGFEKVPIFGESMSSDLEFFLNPRNYVVGRGSITADKPIDTNPECQVLSGDISDAANANTEVQPKGNVNIHQVQFTYNLQIISF